jgi:hypothetical protein
MSDRNADRVLSIISMALFLYVVFAVISHHFPATVDSLQATLPTACYEVPPCV